jgi:hypothetical protein
MRKSRLQFQIWFLALHPCNLAVLSKRHPPLNLPPSLQMVVSKVEINFTGIVADFGFIHGLRRGFFVCNNHWPPLQKQK